MRRLLVAGAAALAVLVSASACTTLQNTITSNTLAAQLVTQEATARVIEAGKTPEERLTRAQKIAKTVADIKQFWDGTASTLPGLVKIATDRIIALKLGPADAILAQALVTELSALIQQKLCPAGATPTTTACSIPADKQFYIDQILDWIASTTSLYVARADMSPRDLQLARVTVDVMKQETAGKENDLPQALRGQLALLDRVFGG